jgi:7-cyano-7-deazaguanine synthase
MTANDHALVLLSGGIDSATALYWAVKQNYDLYTLTFDYAQGSKTELRFAEALSKRVGAREHFALALPFFKTVQDKWPKPEQQSGATSPAYVPARNIVFYGIAAAFAETLGAKWIVFGSNRDDATVLPDATQDFVNLMNTILRAGTKSGAEGLAPQVINPLQDRTKAQVLELALRYGVPLEDTWSCYEDVESPCNKCRGCITRKQTFESVGVADPARTRNSRLEQS